MRSRWMVLMIAGIFMALLVVILIAGLSRTGIS